MFSSGNMIVACNQAEKINGQIPEQWLFLALNQD
jgi:hypothetical protein